MFAGQALEHPFSLAPHLEMISRVFSSSSVEGVVAGLEQEQGEFAAKALNTLRAASPTSLKVTIVSPH